MRDLDGFYIDIARRFSGLSRAVRKRVGCVIIKNYNIVSFGWNGTPHGYPNKCEGEDGKTLPQVIHAEANAISKLARSGISSKDATLYMTLSPCFECAKLIIQSGIKQVIFLEEWKDKKPINFLAECNVKVRRHSAPIPENIR